MRNLYFGLSGEDVKGLQVKLESLGYADFMPSTFFGIKTHLAVRKYQQDHKLPATGIFGLTERGLMGMIPNKTKGEILFDIAMTFVGKDATPKDNVPDDVACMETIDTLCKEAFGSYISGDKITVSTKEAVKVFLGSKQWQEVFKFQKGDILLYPSGYGNGSLSNGHVFLSDGAGKLYSNSSATGQFLQNYSDFTAKYRYETIGGYPKYIFRRII